MTETVDDADIDGFDHLDLEGMEDEVNGDDAIAAQVAEQLEGLGSPVKQEKIQFYIYKAECLNCSHLCSGIKGTVDNDCTFSNGNKKCPAQTVNIAVSVDIEKIAQKLYQAQASGDVSKVARRTKRLKKYSQDVRQQIMKRVSELYMAD